MEPVTVVIPLFCCLCAHVSTYIGRPLLSLVFFTYMAWHVQDQALSLANAAPNSILLGCSEETDEKGQVLSVFYCSMLG